MKHNTFASLIFLKLGFKYKQQSRDVFMLLKYVIRKTISSQSQFFGQIVIIDHPRMQ